jgi:hypothetical protein
MKTTFLFTLLLATLGACQKEEIEQVQRTTYPQTWQLVKLTSSWTNTVQTGENLSWQEQYVFQADSTFTKTRRQNGQVVVADGTFSVRTSASGPYTLLTYTTANNLIGSCTPSQLREYLVVGSNMTLVNNNWRACDGPLLEYKQVAP